MKKVFTIVNEEKGLMQVTTDDERFYIKESKDEVTGLPCHIYLPSATWITKYVPKGYGFEKWLGDKGWDVAQEIKMDRGKYGTRVHAAIEMLVNGEDVSMSDGFKDPYAAPGDDRMEALTFEEYHAVWTFQEWWKEYTSKHVVEVIETEFTLWSTALGFAGTVDLLAKVDGVFTIFDWKTSKSVYLGHKAQISAYRKEMVQQLKTEEVKMAILQLGYDKNKNGYKLTEIEDCWGEFEAAQTFWKKENDGSKPFQKDYPLKLSLIGTGVKVNMSKQTKAVKKEEAPKKVDVEPQKEEEKPLKKPAKKTTSDNK
jgi:hypothetical protein